MAYGLIFYTEQMNNVRNKWKQSLSKCASRWRKGEIYLSFVYLIGAILSEVFGSTMLKITATSKGKLPIVGVVIGYAVSFYLLSLALITISLSFGYAVWSGFGTALTAVVGYIIFKEKLNRQTVLGIGLLIL